MFDFLNSAPETTAGNEPTVVVSALLEAARRAAGIADDEAIDVDLVCTAESDRFSLWNSRTTLAQGVDGYGVIRRDRDQLTADIIPFPLDGHDHRVWVAAGAHENAGEILVGISRADTAA